jgi:hypothetical protein
MSHAWRNIVRFDKIDICSLLSPSTNFFGPNAIVSEILKGLGVKHFRYPLRNGTVVKITNYTDSQESASFLTVPPGNYRSSILLYDEFDDSIFNLRVFFFIKANGTQKYEFK